MAETKSSTSELTYPLRATARLTGLSPELLRAWERRYGVVRPQRTAGGTRRYTSRDIERLRLVKAAVDAGHRVGQVAQLDLAELKRRAAVSDAPSLGRLDEVLAALANLDAPEVQRLLSSQLSALGPVRFAREVAAPLVEEIGERWARQQLGISAEHMATSVLRAMLGSALQPTAASQLGPRIVFATPPGERHELGLQMAALTALGAGANPIYLGADLPVEDVLRAANVTGAMAVALGLVTLARVQAQRSVEAARHGLPKNVRVWLGGSGASQVGALDGVEHIDSLEELERRVNLLNFEGASAS